MSADKCGWELNPNLRTLVDSCFEEGQFETAIETLDQLRAPEFSPWPPHIRQLVYISLQTTQESTTKDGLYSPSLRSPSPLKIQSSPLKMVKQQQFKTSSFSARVITRSQRLLMAYLVTNPPNTLARALPSRRSPSSSTSQNEGDSLVAKRASYIAQLRDCWELLRCDLTPRQGGVTSTPKPRTRTRRYPDRNGDDQLNDESDALLVINEQAWPLLEWLVSLFEHDENISVPNVGHSSLLVDQLLDPRGKAYFDAPINIIVYCLKQTQLQRRRLAGRLLSLLVNSTSTAELDLNALAVAVYTHVPSPDQLSQLLSQLGHSTTVQVLNFKIKLCQIFIGGQGLTVVSNSSKPQPRVRPRLAKGIRGEDSQPEVQLNPPKSSAISTSEVLRLLQLPMPEKASDDPSLTPMWCKFQLLLAFGTLQARLDANVRDSDWARAVEGQLPEIIRNVFEQKGTEASMYQRLLESQLASWR